MIANVNTRKKFHLRGEQRKRIGKNQSFVLSLCMCPLEKRSYNWKNNHSFMRVQKNTTVPFQKHDTHAEDWDGQRIGWKERTKYLKFSWKIEGFKKYSVCRRQPWKRLFLPRQLTMLTRANLLSGMDSSLSKSLYFHLDWRTLVLSFPSNCHYMLVLCVCVIVFQTLWRWS